MTKTSLSVESEDDRKPRYADGRVTRQPGRRVALGSPMTSKRQEPQLASTRVARSMAATPAAPAAWAATISWSPKVMQAR